MGLAGTAPLFVKALRAAGSGSTVYGHLDRRQRRQHHARWARAVAWPRVFDRGAVAVFRPASSTSCAATRPTCSAAGSTEFSLPSLEGYINARVLGEGLVRAGANPSRASLMAALEGIESLDLGGLRVGYGRGRREGGNFVDVAVIGEGGKLLV